MRDSRVRRWSAIHKAMYRLTGGVVGRRLVDNDILLLTTIGRRSGRRHTVPLLYLSDRDRVVVIASYGGRDRHPEWYLNLVAEPMVVARIAATPRSFQARTASPAERGRLWPVVVAAYPGYAEYQTRTARQIPLVILEPLVETPRLGGRS
ncbi:MAG TPA: nitroreductase family deazaflavin-dependent oxidoreductase [Acidimicrobiia bacterium]